MDKILKVLITSRLFKPTAASVAKVRKLIILFKVRKVFSGLTLILYFTKLVYNLCLGSI